MKLFLLRHGDASFHTPSGKDKDRRLSELGKDQIIRLRLFLEMNPIDGPVTTFCSSAIRTQETLHLLKESLVVEESFLVDELYLASSSTLMDYFKEINVKTENVLLIGHNPGISDFASYLTDKEIGFPTAGWIEINFPVIDKWEYLGNGVGGEHIRFFQ